MKKFFLISNYDYNSSNDNFLVKTKNLALSFLFMLLLMIVALAIAESLDYCIKNYLHYESILDSIEKTQSKYDPLIFLVIVVGPFYEELLFRLILKASKLFLSVFNCLLSYTLLDGSIIKFDIHNNQSIANVLFALIVGIVTYWCVSQKSIDFLNRNKKWLIVISIILFGLAHIGNIKTFHWQLLLLYPFFVTPQFILGYFAANLRLKYGLFWGFLLHAMLNGTPYILTLLHF
jgi:Type II CAAX prenyl endopeptidase Rce1-like